MFFKTVSDFFLVKFSSSLNRFLGEGFGRRWSRLSVEVFVGSSFAIPGPESSSENSYSARTTKGRHVVPFPRKGSSQESLVVLSVLWLGLTSMSRRAASAPPVAVPTLVNRGLKGLAGGRYEWRVGGCSSHPGEPGD